MTYCFGGIHGLRRRKGRLQILIEGRRRSQRLSIRIVDHLRIDVLFASKHAEPWASGRAVDPLAYSHFSSRQFFRFFTCQHSPPYFPVLPSFLRSFSPA